jgi:hypothetical protein
MKIGGSLSCRWILALVLAGSGCTNLQRAKRWGSQETVTLPAGRKLVNVTWKDSNLWVLTRPAREGEKADAEWAFDENPSWGILAGKIILKETR